MPLALAKGQPGALYYPENGEQSWGELAAQIGSVLGLPAASFTLDEAIAAWGPRALWTYCSNARTRGVRIRTDLGWTPRIDDVEGDIRRLAASSTDRCGSPRGLSAMMHRTAMAYSVEAYNLSHASENKIHDDAMAQKLGFTGGLVPGVEVYAYACHPAVRRWGRAWLERGQMDCRFLKPVYDGRTPSSPRRRPRAGSTSGSKARASCAPPAELRCPRPPKRRHRCRRAARRRRGDRPPADETSLASDTGSASGRSR